MYSILSYMILLLYCDIYIYIQWQSYTIDIILCTTVFLKCRSGMSPQPPCCVQLSLAMLMSCGDNWERHGDRRHTMETRGNLIWFCMISYYGLIRFYVAYYLWIFIVVLDCVFWWPNMTWHDPNQRSFFLGRETMADCHSWHQWRNLALQQWTLKKLPFTACIPFSW